MIYGHGLQYSDTLRPVLAKRNIDACVFGVAGNAPVDYLGTLNFVRNRIDDGAHIAIYIYVYNDFVSLTKYLERMTRGISPFFVSVSGLINYYDDWRRTTFVQALLRSATTTPKAPLMATPMKVGDGKELKVYWQHDPTQYPAAPPLSREQRATFLFFFKQLRAAVADRNWRVSIVFIPDNEEMLANFAQPSATFRDLDQRRVEALKICAAKWYDCRD
ncbi:MAG TPA: hypothetical protein VNT76_14685, partial [Candidatus Binatus sp.]|nr:hypothetical protein [Candidatus Binatus sp.]